MSRSTERGFARLSPEERRRVASMGGRAAQKVRAFDRRQLAIPGTEPKKEPPMTQRRRSAQATTPAAQPVRSFSTPSLDKLVQLAKPGILQSMRKVQDTSASVLVVLHGQSSLNQALPSESQIAVNEIGVRLAKREGLVELLREKMAGLSARIAQKPTCSHLFALVAAGEDGRYCCTVCDLRMDVDHAAS